MKILGIDPGLERVGFGVIESPPNQPTVYHGLDWGVIKTSSKLTLAQRLTDIYEALTALIDQTKPDCVAIEQLFFFRNVTTMVPVAQARGVIILACHQAQLPLTEYTPLQVKQHLTGFGRAEKSEVQAMVKLQLSLNEIPRPDDAADALAIALTCAMDPDALQAKPLTPATV